MGIFTEAPPFIPYSRFERDGYDNLWLDLPDSETVNSILHEYPIKKRAVITADGIRHSREIDRSKLFQHLLRNNKSRFKRMSVHQLGVEATMFKLQQTSYGKEQQWYSSLVNWFSQKDLPIFAVEKRFNNNFLTGPEAIKLFDALRPTIESAGVKLIRPYGAIGNSLYLPYINGYSLSVSQQNCS